MTGPARILVIKLSALGDFVQAFGPFAAIRAHHRNARITLLTTGPFADLARMSPWFDEVWTDTRPRLWQPGAWLALRARLRGGRFDMVYDLQTSDRSGWYFRLMGRPRWSGIAPGCSHPDSNPEREHIHTIERQAIQLGLAGIAEVPPPDLSWLTADLARFKLPARYALLVPGGAAHRPAKRWPVEQYIALARALAAQGIAPVLIGTQADAGPIAMIDGAVIEARSLLGQTGFAEIAALARGAALAVGNDSGPMHLIAAAGCRAVVLFSAASDPALCAPRGRVTILGRPSLADLPLAEVVAATGHPAARPG